MKARITSEGRHGLKQAHAAVAGALSAVSPQLAKRREAVALAATLTEEIERLQASDDASADAANKLTTKSAQLVAAERQIQRIDAELAPLLKDLPETLRVARMAFRTALLPTLDAFVDDLADKIVLAHHHRSQAVAAARQMPAVVDLGNFLSAAWNTSGVESTERAIALLAQALDGVLPWEFTPNPRAVGIVVDRAAA
jgi:hypothetical protein